MNTFTRTLFFSALVTASLIQGCGCSSKSTVIIEPNPPKPAALVDISGIGVKGIIEGGVISAFTVNANGSFSNQPVSTAVTNALGQYTLQIPETHIGKPIIFRITPASNDTTQHTCDLAIGCGKGVNFGQKYTLPSSSNLVLETLVPALDKNKKVNLSTFSTIAAEKARLALSSNTDTELLTNKITQINATIINMLGLTGDITQLELIDITSEEAIKNAIANKKLDVLRVSALNAAIVSASKNANPGLSVEQALTKAITDIATKGLTSNSSDTQETDLFKILASLQEILVKVKSINTNGGDLTPLLVSVANDLGRVRNEPTDVFNTGASSSGDLLTEDAMAYQFADLIRELSSSEDIILNTHVGNSTIRAQSDKLRAQWAAADLLNSGDANQTTLALAIAANAIAEASNAADDHAALKAYSYKGILVSIEKTNTTKTYRVEQSIYGAKVKMIAEDSHINNTVIAQDDPTQKIEDITAAYGFALQGSASTSKVAFSILEGSRLDVEKISKVSNSQSESLTGVGLKLTLKTQIAQVQSQLVVDPVAIAGTLKLELGQFSFEDANSPTNKGAFAFGFDGTVKNTTGDSFVLAVNINGNTNALSFDEIIAGVDPLDETIQSKEYNALTAAISFNAQLNAQLTNTATVKLQLTRDNPTSTFASLDLMFGPHKLRFSSTIKRLENQPFNLTITNQNRLSMQLSQTDDDAPLTGSIYASDGTTVLADILETGPCVKVTLKSNGNFVCLIDAPSRQ